MDVRAYYQKIRKVEAEIPEPYVVVVSRETPDGGKAGVLTEVSRALAAKLIVEDQAAQATPEQTEEFRAEAERRRADAEKAEAAWMPGAAGRTGKRQGKRQA